MQQAIALFEHFNDEDADWLLETAVERSVAKGESLIEAGTPLDTLHVVVQGLLGVVADEVDAQLALLGSGDLAGEMSFLDGEVPTETVRALEHSTTLAVPHAALRRRAEQDPSFSARLHHAFAKVLADRLRAANRRLSVRADGEGRRDHPAWARLNEPLEALKRGVLHANQLAGEGGGGLPEETSAQFVKQFLAFSDLLNEVLLHEIDNERVREEMGLRVQQELLPYILLTDTAERFYSKPRGYAGDFWTIEMLYRNEPAGATPVGALIDRCFLETSAAIAVRHRRALLAEEIEKAVASREGDVARVTSLACGPARELFDVFSSREDPTELQATLLDIDLHALAYVADEARTRGIERHMSLVSENLVRLALGRAETDIRDQDLVYSIGLIDYFGDDLVVRLMDLVHGMLRPGGRIVLGNIHPRNPTRALLDHVLDWRLIHRTEDDVDRLFQSSRFARPSTNIRFEGEGINLFAECVR